MFKRKEIARLIFGTGLSQLIFVLITPILTRIFSPDDLGTLGAYLSLLSVIVIFLTGRYEMAVVFCKTESYAAAVIKFALIRSVVAALIINLIFVLIFFSWPQAQPFISDYYLLFVIFGALVLAFYNIAVQATLRDAEYLSISLGRIAHSVSFGALGIASAFLFKPTFLLLCLSDLIARGVAFGLIVRNTFRHGVNPTPLKVARQRYARFSRFEQMTATLSVLSIQSPMILIPLIFDAATAGLYFIVFRAVMSPVSLISNAVFDVFKVEATQLVHDTGTCQPLVIYTVSRLFLLGLVPAALLAVFGKVLFVTVFGADWAVAGLYAQILAPSVLLRFVAAPIGFVLQLRERVGLNTIFYGLFFVATCISLGIGWWQNSPVVMVVGISAGSCILYIFQIYLAYRFSGQTKNSSSK